MKILLYFEGQNVIGKSGIGRALSHQKRALSSIGIDYTLDPKATDYDILHINTYGPKSLRLVKKAKRLGKKIVFHAHSTACALVQKMACLFIPTSRSFNYADTLFKKIVAQLWLNSADLGYFKWD